MTRTAIVSLFGLLIFSVWSPAKTVLTTPTTCSTCPIVIEDRLLFNSSISELSKEFDSSQDIILAKTAIVDRQDTILNKLTKNEHISNSNLGASHTTGGFNNPELQGVQLTLDSHKGRLYYNTGTNNNNH